MVVKFSKAFWIIFCTGIGTAKLSSKVDRYFC